VVEVNNEKDSVPLEDVDAGTVGYGCHREDQVSTEGSEDASEPQGEEAEANSQGEKDSDTDDDGDAETDQGGEESDASTVAAKKIYLPFISTALLVPDGMMKAHLAGAHSCHRSAMRAAILLAEKLGFIDLHAVDSAREKVCPDTKLRRCLHLFPLSERKPSICRRPCPRTFQRNSVGPWRGGLPQRRFARQSSPPSSRKVYGSGSSRR
jgi:hypothetical protein